MTHKRKYEKKLLIGIVSCAILFFLFPTSVIAQYKVPFKPRISNEAQGRHKGKSNYKLQGDFTIIGNTNIVGNPYRDNGSNTLNMKFVNVSGDNNIVNSSSSRFELPRNIPANCTKIIYAGLYWAGRGDAGDGDILGKKGFLGGVSQNAGNGLNKKTVLFKTPAMSEFVKLKSEEIYFANEAKGMYTGYYDVTSHVIAGGVGDYFVGNIATYEGNDSQRMGYYAGWGLVIVYENTSMKWRDITVFDGFSDINDAMGYSELNLSGFNASKQGDVNVTIGIMGGEGDVHIDGDYVSIEDKDEYYGFTALNHKDNGINNFFNSSISTGSNHREPRFQNNYGIDIGIFNINNKNNRLIKNGQTSTKFRFGSTQDGYSVFNITFGVDAYVPTIHGVNSTISDINSDMEVLPGEIIEYELSIFNKGVEDVTGATVEIPLPPTVYYVNSEIKLGGGTVKWSHPTSNDPLTTPGGKIIWTKSTFEKPSDPSNEIAKLSYKLKVTEDCNLLSTSNNNCSNIIKIDGIITGVGKTSKTDLLTNFISGYETAPCDNTPNYKLIEHKIKLDSNFTANCNIQLVNGYRQYKLLCNDSKDKFIEREQIVKNYPVGTIFYAINPNTSNYQSSIVNGDFPVSNNDESNKFYAKVPGLSESCFLQLETRSDNIDSTPIVDENNFCIDSEFVLNVELSDNGKSNELELFYFEKETDDEPLESQPNPKNVGIYNYFVAEGVKNQNRRCFGPRVPVLLKLSSGPLITQDLKNDYVCVGGDKTLVIESEATSVFWEFYDVDSSEWTVLDNNSFGNILQIINNKIIITSASPSLDKVKLRARLLSDTGCETNSEIGTIEIRYCNIPINPMIRSQIKGSESRVSEN